MVKKTAIELEKGQKIVMAFYHGWYGNPWGPSGKWIHWNHWIMDTSKGEIIGWHNPDAFVGDNRRDLGAVHYPLLGPYDVKDPEVLRTHFKWAKEAGIDGFIFDWCGPPGDYIDKNFELMLNTSLETNYNLTFAVLYDDYQYRNAPPQEVYKELNYIVSKYGNNPLFLKVQEYPVIFIYACQHFHYTIWDEIISRLKREAGLEAIFLCDTPLEEYLQVFDGVYTYTPAEILHHGQNLYEIYSLMIRTAKRNNALYALTVLPGYDDTVIRRPGFKVPRSDGATYSYTWNTVLEHDPKWVLICSWNEWHEGTEIEPSFEEGFKYLNLTKQYIDKFKEKE